MKTIRSFLILSTFILGVGTKAFSQDPQQLSNYVVIGAFAKLNNAVRFTDAANQDNFQAQYAINPQRKLYYVFILNTLDRKKAFSFLLRIRIETKYKDAWVYNGRLGEETEPVVVNEPLPKVEDKPVEPVIAEPVIEQPVVTIDSSALKKPIEEVVVPKPAGKPFYFKLVNSESGNEVMGEVQVVESKATQYQGFKGNEIVYLIPPKNNTGIYQVTVQAPGYKPAKVAFNYKDPSAISSGVGDKQETIVEFALVRAKKGDYIDFNNVRFFQNSTILEPMSQGELDGLAALMKERQTYKIRIHGHCNSDEARDIITLGSSPDIFALNPSQNKREKATAKRLTELRAEAVKNYLSSQGVEPDHITTKGEGGKMMIYPSASTLANYNDRVEIEVLKGK